jgi:hypothetical protein
MRTRQLVGRLAVAAAISLALSAGFAPVALAAPSNDDWAGRRTVSALPYSDTQAIDGATDEPTEPTTACYRDSAAPFQTAWYTFRPTRTMYVRADTFGSTYETEMAVFTGSALESLTPVGCTTDTSEEGQDQSSLAWRALKNVAYSIQVDSTSSPVVGTLRFRLLVVSRPSNDDFAGARVVARLPYHATLSNRNATYASNEPASACAISVGATVWYRYTAPKTQTVQVQTLSSNFDTVLSVFRGTSAASLVPVICSDDTSGGYDRVQSLVTFKATKGQSYYVQAGGWAAASGQLDLAIRSVVPPVNDRFAAATAFTLGDQWNPTTRRATKEAGEPGPTCANAIGATVWYTFTLGATGTIQVDVSADDFEDFAAIYSGGSLATLTEHLCVADDIGNVLLDAGTYFVQVGGHEGGSGDIRLVIQQL